MPAYLKPCFDAFIYRHIWIRLERGIGGDRGASVAHFSKSSPDNAFVLALFLTFKAGGGVDEAELREEQDMGEGFDYGCGQRGVA